MTHKPKIYDMHCHLDFADDCEQVAKDALGESIACLDATVVPSSYVIASEKFRDNDNVHISLGLHPWWVAEQRISEADITRFEKLLPRTSFIGEIGLDYSKRFSETWSRQLEVFYRVLDAIKEAGGGKLITIHAVRSYHDMFKALETSRVLEDNDCIFHWFSGNRDDFGQALALGCYFSVSMRMMASEKGAYFAKAIPNERLLLETDNPPHEGLAWAADTWRQELDNTVTALAELRTTDIHEVSTAAACNAIRLLQRDNEHPTEL